MGLVGLLKTKRKPAGVDLSRRDFLKRAVKGTAVGAGLLYGLDAIAPENADASDLTTLIRQADKAFQSDDYAKAVSLYQTAIKRSNGLGKQKQAELWFKLGFSYGELKQWDKGIDAYGKGMTLGPEIKTSSPPYKTKEAERLCDQGIRLKKKDPQKAIELYEKAKKIEPDNPRINYHAGWAHHFADDSEGAIKEFKKAIKKDVFYLYPYISLAKQFYDKKSPTECIFIYDVVMVMSPENKYGNLFKKRIAEMKKLV